MPVRGSMPICCQSNQTTMSPTKDIDVKHQTKKLSLRRKFACNVNKKIKYRLLRFKKKVREKSR